MVLKGWRSSSVTRWRSDSVTRRRRSGRVEGASSGGRRRVIGASTIVFGGPNGPC